MNPTFALLLCLLATGCSTLPATQFSLPKERATECAANCESLDMKLTAMVVIRNSAGCVCEPKDALPQTAARRNAASTLAGTVVAEDDERAEPKQVR
ncbi:hypothetical protein POL68_16965 [Stigmatella sp. ncwal1]|uniref:Lipoprotein n=1 Tax=Stigmatella ashevillensis TaxID=2995309 RepID=A0ABT5D925_9BACT|nr:hypothetical protein [Stigmatella ashevillena]MDC0710171.1 hypothetical protein [Stigmatella ashevillena]